MNQGAYRKWGRFFFALNSRRRSERLRLACLHDFFSVDRREIILHRDRLDAHLIALALELFGRLKTPVIALRVVAEEHVGLSAVLHGVLRLIIHGMATLIIHGIQILISG